MTSLHLTISLSADPDKVWRAASAVATPHLDLAPGFVVACELIDHARTVTFRQRCIRA